MKEIKSNRTRRQRIIVGIIVLLLGSVVLGSLWQTWAAPEPGRFAPNLLWGVLMLGLLMGSVARQTLQHLAYNGSLQVINGKRSVCPSYNYRRIEKWQTS